MYEFFTGYDLWSNICGGITAAVAFAILVAIWDWWKKTRPINQLIDVRAKIIKHRDIGSGTEVIDYQEWIDKAKGLHDEAVEKAKNLSPSAGAHVEWLGERSIKINVDRFKVEINANFSGEGQELKYWLSILDTVQRRILDILERTI